MNKNEVLYLIYIILFKSNFFVTSLLTFISRIIIIIITLDLNTQFIKLISHSPDRAEISQLNYLVVILGLASKLSIAQFLHQLKLNRDSHIKLILLKSY